MKKRCSGILLHPTSLPGSCGIGDLGESAYHFIDFLVHSRQSLWQILPITPPSSFGNSPYQCLSSFAGNPLLISLDSLQREYEISLNLEQTFKELPHQAVNFDEVSQKKQECFHQVFQHFKQHGSVREREQFERYKKAQDFWLTDFAEFMSIKEAHEDHPWNEWPASLSQRETAHLKQWDQEHSEEIEYHQFLQYHFHQQWTDLKDYAGKHQIQIIGDIPIFVAFDSADVWANQQFFELGDNGHPTVIAGVPPDYFSETGQRWGNPLYRWNVMKEDQYSWWQARIQHLLEFVDIIRIDHFRGFEKYWEIPASEPTAIHGQWIAGPGLDFFQTIESNLPGLRLIAEDLGIITPEVEQLRDSMNYPGMKVLQFAFSEGTQNPYLPHNYQNNHVVYTGTHDNNTTRGWYHEISEYERTHVAEYLRHDVTEETVSASLIRLAWASTALMAITPLQDILNLGESARMNTPGVASGNWGWRFEEGALTEQIQNWLARLTRVYERTF
jgi:4-alpha-glucanotransferase